MTPGYSRASRPPLVLKPLVAILPLVRVERSALEAVKLNYTGRCATSPGASSDASSIGARRFPFERLKHAVEAPGASFA